MMSSQGDKSAPTIAFTLPVSCQICLGKVKEPVVCPNQHVFCAPCMEVWLTRNQQCPACRIVVTKENPCRPVIGGLNPQVENEDNFSSRELRRARMELIYKDYEHEIDRLEAEMEITRHENEELRNRLRGREDAGLSNKAPASPSAPSDRDISVITSLNVKLSDATRLYDKVKADTDRIKLENAQLRDQHIDMKRENDRLRLELGSRSPRKFGRLTVAALEKKVEASERQNGQLQKALTRSDAYVEELEKELDSYRSKANGIPSDLCKAKYPSTIGEEPKETFETPDMDSLVESSKAEDTMDELPSRISTTSEFLNSDMKFDDTDTFNDRFLQEDKSSFDLDVPSPMTTNPSKTNLTETDFTEESLIPDDTLNLALPKPPKVSEGQKEGKKKKSKKEKAAEKDKELFNLPMANPSQGSEVTVEGTKKRLRFTSVEEFKAEIGIHSLVPPGGGDMPGHPYPMPGFNNGGDSLSPFSPQEVDLGVSKERIASIMSGPNATNGPKLPPGAPDMNMSMTPEIEDCFRIMDEAKRKVEQRQNLPASAPGSTHDALGLSSHNAPNGSTHNAPGLGLTCSTNSALGPNSHSGMTGMSHNAHGGGTHGAMGGSTHSAMGGSTHSAFGGPFSQSGSMFSGRPGPMSMSNSLQLNMPPNTSLAQSSQAASGATKSMDGFQRPNTAPGSIGSGMNFPGMGPGGSLTSGFNFSSQGSGMFGGMGQRIGGGNPPMGLPGMDPTGPYPGGPSHLQPQLTTGMSYGHPSSASLTAPPGSSAFPGMMSLGGGGMPPLGPGAGQYPPAHGMFSRSGGPMDMGMSLRPSLPYSHPGPHSLFTGGK